MMVIDLPGKHSCLHLLRNTDISRCMEDSPQIRVNVDLDKEKNDGKKISGKNEYRFQVRRTTHIKFDLLDQYLRGKTDWTNDCLEAITFIDHLMREMPRRNLNQIKRSFFPQNGPRLALGSGVEAAKGVYASLRVAYNGHGNGASLVANVDVANGTFWMQQTMMQALCAVTRARNPDDLARMFRPALDDPSNFKKTQIYDMLKRVRRVKVLTYHRDKQNGEEFIIDKVIAKDPTQYTFKMNEGKPDERTVSLQQYWRQTYNINTQPGFGVVEMTKKMFGKPIAMPIDTLRIKPNQRYALKLDDQQTSQMIKFAVTVPAERWNNIQKGTELLNWQSDKYLKNYGLEISAKRVEVKGRILPTPDVTFANGSIAGTQAGQGRWRIDGKKFMTSNPTPLKSWGVCVIQDREAPDQAATAAFFKNFVSIYQGHGGKIANPSPVMLPGHLQRGGEMITDIWNATGQKNNSRPEILFFVMHRKDTMLYKQIKKSCDVRYGVVSQCLQARHVKTNQGQYISNVCMKVCAPNPIRCCLILTRLGECQTRWYDLSSNQQINA